MLPAASQPLHTLVLALMLAAALVFQNAGFLISPHPAAFVGLAFMLWALVLAVSQFRLSSQFYRLLLWLAMAASATFAIAQPLLFSSGFVIEGNFFMQFLLMAPIALYMVWHTITNAKDSQSCYRLMGFLATPVTLTALLCMAAQSQVSIPHFSSIYTVFMCVAIVIAWSILEKSILPKPASVTNPHVTQQLLELLSQRCTHYGVEFSEFIHGTADGRHRVSFQLIFPPSVALAQSHQIASDIELTLTSFLANRAQIVIHLKNTEQLGAISD